MLRFNVFARKYPRARQLREIDSVVAYLQTEAQAGRIGDALLVGWPGSGIRPTNAVDTDDEAIMRPWRKRAFVVAVRVTECATSAESKRILGYEEAPT